MELREPTESSNNGSDINVSELPYNEYILSVFHLFCLLSQKKWW